MFFLPHLPSPELYCVGSMCASTNTISSPHFYLTQKNKLQTHFPSPLPHRVLEGATRRLEQTNNLGNLETGTPIWIPQGGNTGELYQACSQLLCYMYSCVQFLDGYFLLNT